MRASIVKNTNRAISSSEESWGSVRDNTMVRFGTDNDYYNVGSVNSFFLIKEFEKISGNVIKIVGDTGIELSIGDCVSLSYKEYELLTVLKSINKGSGYKVSDVLYLKGGTPYTNITTNEILTARLIVSSVDSDGGITQLRLDKGGRYLETPNNQVELIGGKGTGAMVHVDYSVIDNRTLVEKTINKINKETGATFLTFDSVLPDGVTKGKISIEKWEMFLTSNYAGESKNNEIIEFIRDFSPFLKIPFLSKNNASPEVIYNLALSTIDKAFRDMQDQINRLKKN